MPRFPMFFVALGLSVPVVAAGGEDSAATVTLGSLLEEMGNLERLARWPSPSYRTVQFSSFDRRSTSPEAPGWFENADGFGGEPIPGFAKTLREPGPGAKGLYLVAEMLGPGAIVRGWSAGMGGTLKVCLDGSPEPIWEGPAYDFLARRSGRWMKAAGIVLDADDAFSQQDADYFPVPFEKSLLVTWEGDLGELHFYHLQVRSYSPGTRVLTFHPEKDLEEFQPQLRAAVAALTRPECRLEGESHRIEAALDPGREWKWSPEKKGPGAISEIELRLEADRIDEALRGTLLRISFDGSLRPQVEAPVGDFFASGPGINPYSSLPFTVKSDGTMTCRFVMPYCRSVEIDLQNFTSAPARLRGSVKISPWTWGARSLHFRAKWRADHDLLGSSKGVDVPYAVVIGKGLFLGCAAMIMNPSGVPTAWGNWWGEGDEKILVDGEASPSTFGTGSEDYFNYSWSRSDLFDHPYCGQPLDSGPDTSGYVSNHRFQIMDAIAFERSLGAYLELMTHSPTPGLSYARIAYLYAFSQAADDHRALMPSDLKVPPLPVREPKASHGAARARFHHFEDLKPSVTAGKLESRPLGLATRGRILAWEARRGEKLVVSLPVEKESEYGIHLVLIHRKDGATLQASLDGKPLGDEGERQFSLETTHATRNLNVHLRPVRLSSGEHRLCLQCTSPGFVGLDYLWIQPAR